MALIHPMDDAELAALEKRLKLTRIMRQAILTAVPPYGRLIGDGNRRDKTYPALRERGLAEIERQRWVLTELGMRVRCTWRANQGLPE